MILNSIWYRIKWNKTKHTHTRSHTKREAKERVDTKRKKKHKQLPYVWCAMMTVFFLFLRLFHLIPISLSIAQTSTHGFTHFCLPFIQIHINHFLSFFFSSKSLSLSLLFFYFFLFICVLFEWWSRRPCVIHKTYYLGLNIMNVMDRDDVHVQCFFLLHC